MTNDNNRDLGSLADKWIDKLDAAGYDVDMGSSTARQLRVIDADANNLIKKFPELDEHSCWNSQRDAIVNI